MTALLGGLAGLGLACAELDLRYPEPPGASEANGLASPAPAQPGGEPVVGPAAADARDPYASAEPGATDESGRSWSELTKLARDAQLAGDYEAASAWLEQAAIQVASLPPGHALRRATFGMRARHAMGLAVIGRVEEADTLADALFAEAEQTPEVGGPALATLAVSVVDRRQETMGEAGLSPLPLLELALDALENEPASQERLAFAFRVHGDALHERDLPLARRAIERAIADAQRVAPLDRMQAASLRVYKARVALLQGDAEAALAAASIADRLFEEADADGSSRGVGLATLAHALAAHGDREAARETAARATTRLDEDRRLVPHARRQMRASLARVARLLDDPERARSHYRAGLAIPPADSRLDLDLIEAMREELAELEATPAA